MQRAQEHISAGFAIVVDLDLEKFFDRVNHDILMGLLAKRVADKPLLKLVRGFLTAGVLDGGLVSPATEGTPQGGPLSPLLSNLMLDVLDKELETRGHRFVRYADDCNIYVRSRRAGARVEASVTHFLARRLKLTVNVAKSAVDPPGGAILSGLQLYRGTNTPAAHRWTGGGPVQGSGPGADAGHEQRRSFPPDHGVVPLPCRVAGLLRLLRDPFGLAPPRPMDQTSASRLRLAAVETRAHSLCSVAPPRRR